MQSNIGRSISVAWWPPLYLEATAHNFATFLALLSVLIAQASFSIIGAMIMLLASLIHPPMALCTFVFCGILLFDFEQYERILRMPIFRLFPGFMIGLVVSISCFDAGGVFSARELADIYVREAHAEHYLPSHFGSLGRFKWYEAYIIVLSTLLLAAYTLWRLNESFWKNALLAAVAYAVVLLAQYLFVEKFPVAIFVRFGISRFFVFGPWLAAICVVFVIISIFEKSRADGLWKKLDARIALVPFIPVLSLVVISGSLLTWQYAYHAESFEKYDKSTDELMDFARSQPVNEVFVLPFEAPIADFPLLTRRPVFIGNGFPFVERFYREWKERKTSVFGSDEDLRKLPGSWVGEQISNFYRTLAPSDFVRIASKYPVHWVVVETDYANAFSRCRISLRNARWTVFSVNELHECAK
jgi:hypothetical protein